MRRSKDAELPSRKERHQCKGYSSLPFVNNHGLLRLINGFIGATWAESLAAADELAQLFPGVTIRSRFAVPQNTLAWSAYIEKLRRNSSLKHLEIFHPHPVSSDEASTDLVADGKTDVGSLDDLATVLENNSTLEHLRIDLPSGSGELANSFWNALKSNRGLKCLKLVTIRIPASVSSALCECLSENTALVRLDLSRAHCESGVVISIMEALAVNQALRYLDLSDCKVVGPANSYERSRKLAYALTRNSTLKHLNLKGAGLGEYISGSLLLPVALTKNTGLEYLGVDCNELNNEFPLMLASVFDMNQTLEHVGLADNRFDSTPRGLEALASLAKALKRSTTLKRLDLSGTILESVGGYLMCDALKTNKTLTHLNLENTSLCDNAGVSLAIALEANSSLRHLNLRLSLTMKGGEAIIKALAKNKGLSFLDLSQNFLSCSSTLANSLCKNTTLVHLELRKNEGLVNLALVKALSANSSLQYLGIGETDIQHDVVCCLSKILERNRTILRLDLGCNDIAPCGCEAIARALEKNTTLKHLSLKKCRIKGEGFEVISSALGKNTALRRLNLCGALDDVGDQVKAGASKAIANALRANATLRYLDLGANKLGAGCSEIARALKANSTLRYLSLRSNMLGDCESLDFAGTSLHALDLGKNGIGRRHVADICLILETNSKLQKVGFYGNDDFPMYDFARSIKVQNTRLDVTPPETEDDHDSDDSDELQALSY